jgi:hypothetical protein
MPDELVIRFQQRYVGKDPWIEITLHVLAASSPYLSGAYTPGLPVTAFRKELLATVFAPSPPGLYNPDCFRIYEALFTGAIPIIPRHYQFDPLGDHPIPMVDSWCVLFISA